jgi:sulfatase maturation enzyme AslB (radical SAM superfamily)
MKINEHLGNDYGPQRLTVELANICNLHCSYCFRDDDNLYNSRAEFFPPNLLRKILTDARDTAGTRSVIFTGGEPTLHPQFDEILQIVSDIGLTGSFITNGWHFERIWPAVLNHRSALSHVAFSLDGPTRESHDRWRGKGSFDRLVQAFSRCYLKQLPFVVKMNLRRDLINSLEESAIFAARMGASALNFAHVSATSDAIERESSLTLTERRNVEHEIALLARILKMPVRIDVGYYNIDEESAPCSPLAGTNMNVDFRGRLTLCCNLSGFRDAGLSDSDVVADLKTDSFASAFSRLKNLANTQLERRRERLQYLRLNGIQPDLNTGSPCQFCLQSFGKTPWSEVTNTRSLPVKTVA